MKVLDVDPFWEGTFNNLPIYTFQVLEKIFFAMVCIIFRSTLESEAIKLPKPFIRSLPFKKKKMSFDLLTLGLNIPGIHLPEF